MKNPNILFYTSIYPEGATLKQMEDNLNFCKFMATQKTKTKKTTKKQPYETTNERL